MGDKSIFDIHYVDYGLSYFGNIAHLIVHGK